MDRLIAFWTEESGQDLVEYTLLIVAFVLLTFAIVTGGFPSIAGIWHTTQSNLGAASQFAGGGS